VKLTYGGKNHSLGYFADEHAAAMAYDEAARRVLGESAAPNFLTAEETAELLAREAYEKRARTKGSLYRGVNWNQGKWQAEIRHEGKKKYIGRFESEEKAALAYDEAAVRMKGGGADLNFPNGAPPSAYRCGALSLGGSSPAAVATGAVQPCWEHQLQARGGHHGGGGQSRGIVAAVGSPRPRQRSMAASQAHAEPVLQQQHVMALVNQQLQGVIVHAAALPLPLLPAAAGGIGSYSAVPPSATLAQLVGGGALRGALQQGALQGAAGVYCGLPPQLAARRKKLPPPLSPPPPQLQQPLEHHGPQLSDLLHAEQGGQVSARGGGAGGGGGGGGGMDALMAAVEQASSSSEASNSSSSESGGSPLPTMMAVSAPAPMLGAARGVGPPGLVLA